MSEKSTGKKNGEIAQVLHVGIDLGTSRSAIVASNGQRHWEYSFVGWPKDFIARKMLKKEVIFGAEAIDHRLSVDLVRPLEYGVIRDGTQRDEEAVRQLIHHLINLVQAEKGQKIYAAVGVPAEALTANKLAIREAVREYADTLMVISEPFAVAYSLGALNNACVVDIGAGTIDFCVMHGTMPTEEDQRTLRTAGDTVDKQLYSLLREKYPSTRISETQVRQLKETHGRVGKAKGRIVVQMPVAGKFVPHDITAEITQACESLITPIAETLIDLIARYEPMLQERVRNNIYLAGGGSQTKGMAQAIAKALAEYGEFRITPVDDPLFIGAEGALSLAEDMPSQYWENM